MGRTKVQIPLARAATESVARPVLRAAAGPAPKPAAAKAAPKPAAAEAVQIEVNHTPDFVAAGVVPHGKPVAAGRVELVGPGGAYSPPTGLDLRCFLHRDGTGVKFAGAAGDVFLDRRDAQSEFGALLPSAAALLAAHPPAAPAAAAKPAPAKPAPAKPAAAIRRAAEATTAPTADAASTVARAADRSAGTPLPTAARAKLESSYGADLGGVKVHTDTAASDAARAVHAHAFTSGQDIYFRAGQYNPGTAGGDKLLAHEVAHTVQQGPAADAIAKQSDAPELQISEPGDRVEREADAAADRAVRGQPASLRPAGAGIARLADGPPVPAPPQPAPKPVEKVAEKKPAKPAAGAAPGGDAGAAPGGPVAAPGAKVEAKADAKAPAAPGAKAGAAPGGAAGPGPTAGPTAGPAAGPSEGLQSVVAQVGGAGTEQKVHDPAAKKADDAQASVGVTAEKAVGDGQAGQLGAMAAAKPDAKKGFDKRVFKARLLAKITALQNEDAKAVKEGNKAGGINEAVKGEVATGKAAAAGDLPATAAQEPPKGQPAAGPTVAADPTAPAPAVDGRKAVPAPVPDAAVSLAPAATAVDASMADAKVTPEQLQKANEPSFTAAAAARDAAHTGAEALPAQARAAETKTLGRAANVAAETTQVGLVGMQGARADKLGAARDQQTAGAAKHAELKKAVAAKFGAIYEKTKADVDARLAKLDEDVKTTFDTGAERAKAGLYLFIDIEIIEYFLKKGLLLGLGGVLFGDPEYKAIYDRGRNNYLKDMEAVIDAVAAVVGDALNGVVAALASGKAELDAALLALKPEEQKVGQEVAGDVQKQFAELEKRVEDKQTEIIDSVAAKYVAAQKEVDATLNAMKDPVGALIDYAKEAVGALIETLRQMRELLASVFAKAAEAIDLILADPVGFVLNLVTGVKQGLLNFASNIGTHLQKGLFEWLFGALAKAGIQIPDKFDLSGIMSIVLQVLGLTWTNIRKRAVAIVGEKVVKALETASEIVVILVTKGPAGLWEFLKEKASDLIQTVLDGIKTFLIEKVVMAGVTWIIGLLNPASAFIKACKAIYDIVMWVVNNGRQLVEFVNAVLDSVLSIAKGNLAPAAAAVEKALAKAVPVAIGFLAGLLGLGGLSDKIKEIIEKIQAPINAAIDWIIKKAVSLAKAVGKMFGGKEKKEDPDPEHSAKVTAGLQTLGEHTAKVRKDESITYEESIAAANATKKSHPVFKSITVVDKAGAWVYVYKASQGDEVVAGKKKDGDLDKRVAVGLLVLAEWGGDMKLAEVAQVDEKQKVVFMTVAGKRGGRRGVGFLIINEELKNSASLIFQIALGIPIPLGAYASLVGFDPASVGPKKLFTKRQKDAIRDKNKADHGGQLRSDGSSKAILVHPKDTDPAKPPPALMAEVDHIIPRAAGGINTCSNAQVLSREENNFKSDN